MRAHALTYADTHARTHARMQYSTCRLSEHALVFRMTLATVDERYESCVTRRTTYIVEGTSHPLYKFYSVAKSGCRDLFEKGTHEQILQFSANFHHAAQREIGDGEVNGEAGGIYNGETRMNCAASVTRLQMLLLA